MRTSAFALLAATTILVACASPNANTETGGTSGGAAQAATSTAGAVPGTEQDLKQNVGDRIFFRSDESGIDAEGRKILERQAQWLKRYPKLIVTIEGHCDERGTREYNLALGVRRANAARMILIAAGVDAQRINTITYGKERPAVLGSYKAAWAQNRRAVTVVN